MYSFSKAAVTKYHKLGGLTEIYCLTDLEARSPKSRSLQGWFLLRAVRKNLFPASLLASGGCLATFGIPWLVNAPAHLCLHLCVMFPWVCVCLQISPFYEDTNHIGLEIHSTLVWPHLNYLHLQRPYFQIRSYSEAVGGGGEQLELQHMNLKGETQLQPSNP